MGVQVPRQAPFARVTELVYVSDSNPDAARLVSSNLTSRTIYRTGVMGAHLALTQEDEDRNLGAVPVNLRNNAGRLRHQSRKLWAAEMLWGSTPLFRANLQCCQSGNGPAWKAAAGLKSPRRFKSFTLRHNAGRSRTAPGPALKTVCGRIVVGIDTSARRHME